MNEDNDIGNGYNPAPEQIIGLDKFGLQHLAEIAEGALYQRGGLAHTLKKIDVERFRDERARELWPKIDLGKLAKYLCMWSSRYMYLVSVLKTDPAQLKSGGLPQLPEDYFVETVNSGGFVSVTKGHLADPTATSSLNPFCLIGGKRGKFLVMPRLVNPNFTEISRKDKDIGSNGAVIRIVNDTSPFPEQVEIRISRSNQSNDAHSCIGVLSSEMYDDWLESGQQAKLFPMVMVCTFYPERNLKPVIKYVGPGAYFYGMYFDWYYNG